MLLILLIILLIIYRNKFIKYILENKNIIIIFQIIILLYLLKSNFKKIEKFEKETNVEEDIKDVEEDVKEDVKEDIKDVEEEPAIQIDENVEEKNDIGEVILEEEAEKDIIEDPKLTEETEVLLPGKKIIPIQPIKTDEELNKELAKDAENKYNILPTDQWVTPNAKDIFKQTSCMCPQVSSFNEYYSVLD